MDSRSIKMKDVAERANVSLTTVSRVLRGERLERFSTETRQRIEEAARSLGWRPNLLVRGIQTGRTNTIGVVVPPFDTFWTRVLYGIHDELLATDRVPIVLWPQEGADPTEAKATTDEDLPAIGGPRRELQRLHLLVDRRVDGIIAWPLFEQDALDFLTKIGSQGLPIVTIDHQLPGEAKSLTIEIDELAAMALVIDHLTSLGHCRVMFLGYTSKHTWAGNRRQAFERAVGERHAGSVLLEEHHDDVALAVHATLRDKPDITAVVAATDHLAVQAIRGAASLGRDVPRDVSVVGFGNLEFESGTSVPLTTINQHPHLTGQRAARDVLRREAFTRRRRVTIQPELMVRGSTGPALMNLKP